MSQAFVGEIRVFSGNYAPQGWALCNGQMLDINDNPALFVLIGTTYGGNGSTNFGVPNLQAALAVGVGTGPTTPTGPYGLGSTGGAVTVTLSNAQMPAHTHAQTAATGAATSASPTRNLFAKPPSDAYGYYNNPPPTALHELAAAAVTSAGGSQAHANIMPVMGLTYIIALQGIFPTFSN
jgi:microcystin-dependent protein